MGNITQSMKDGTKVFTDTFGPGGTFEVLFRDTMIRGITNQVNKLLLDKDALIPSELFNLLSMLQKEVGYVWGEAIILAMKSVKEVQTFLQDKVVPFLEKTWDKNKWDIITMFIILNPLAFIGFVISFSIFLLTVYYVLLKKVFHPLFSMLIGKYIFKIPK